MSDRATERPSAHSGHDPFVVPRLFRLTLYSAVRVLRKRRGRCTYCQTSVLPHCCSRRSPYPGDLPACHIPRASRLSRARVPVRDRQINCGPTLARLCQPSRASGNVTHPATRARQPHTLTQPNAPPHHTIPAPRHVLKQRPQSCGPTQSKNKQQVRTLLRRVGTSEKRPVRDTTTKPARGPGPRRWMKEDARTRVAPAAAPAGRRARPTCSAPGARGGPGTQGQGQGPPAEGDGLGQQVEPHTRRNSHARPVKQSARPL